MLSPLHQAVVELFRQQPALAVDLLGRVFGVEVPQHEGVRIEATEFTDLQPAELRADAVIVLAGTPTPALAVVVEVQLRRDPGKQWSWPIYLAALRGRLRCPTMLLVVCTDESTATWCVRPIELGHPGHRLVPLVLGPRQVPVLDDPAEALRAPELAVLSAMAHGADPARTAVLDAFVVALRGVDEDRLALYSDVVMAMLPQAARHHLEALVITGTYEYQSDFVRKYIFQGRVEGEARGEARAVLSILEARGLPVPSAVRERVEACQDVDQLDSWVRRAVIVASADALFD